MIQFNREYLCPELIKEIGELAKLHVAEIGVYNRQVDIDWNSYIKIQEVGSLAVFAARDEDKSLAGYMVCIVLPHPHYRNMLTAETDVVYLSPKHRKGWAGKRMIQFVEAYMKAIGVEIMQQHVKEKRDMRNMLERMGYKTCDIIMFKEL